MVVERSREDVVARRALESGGDRGFDGVGEDRVGRDEDGRRVGTVLGLGDEVGRDTIGVGRRRGEDHALRRAGRQVDADLAADLELGRGHPGIARADDAVDGLEPGVG